MVQDGQADYGVKGLVTAELCRPVGLGNIDLQQANVDFGQGGGLCGGGRQQTLIGIDAQVFGALIAGNLSHLRQGAGKAAVATADVEHAQRVLAARPSV